ncbi:neuromedin-K receptor-like [Mytilus galloprovincialis]|uniref:neuromedin-K receptor-like n=1 Tax=Mytilus galloprovincialis TaxID=29158 RepID=UPI003F7B9EA0
MSEFDEVLNLYNFSDNLTNTELQYLESWRNLSGQKGIFPVSTGVLTILALLYGSISLIAIVGNGIVIFVVASRRKMQTVTNVFLANLALADVVIGIFSTPFQFHSALLQRWVVARFMCKTATFVKNLSVIISILTLTLIAIDRYVAVMYPLRAGFRKKIAIIVLFMIWTIGTVSSVPDLLFYNVETMFDLKYWTKKPICRVEWPSKEFSRFYFTYLLLLQYVVPLSIISVVYIRVAHRIWGSNVPGNETDHNDIRAVNKKKVVKMLIIVVSLFGFCWLPLQTYNFVSAFYPKINRFKYINIIWFCSDWLAMSNSCYNPFIYGLLNEKFKREFKNLRKICTKKKRTESNYLTEDSERLNQRTSIMYRLSDSSNERRIQSRKPKRSVCFIRSGNQATKL